MKSCIEFILFCNLWYMALYQYFLQHHVVLSAVNQNIEKLHLKSLKGLKNFMSLIVANKAWE